MRKHLYVAGTDLATYGVYVSGQGTFGAPSKDVTTYSVPGRNGLILGVNERMENIQVTYPCFIYTNFETNMRNLRSFLLSQSGYVKINDDYDTTHFRMGFFEAGIDPDVTEKNDAGSFNLTFNCQPQRLLNSGQTKTTVTSSTTFTNPTLFNSKPLIRLNLANTISSTFRVIVEHGTYGNPGFRQTTFYIDGAGVAAESVSIIDLDCETMQAYSGAKNMSKYISVDYSAYGEPSVLNIADFAEFVPGGNDVYSLFSSGNLTDMEVTPRWWEV